MRHNYLKFCLVVTFSNKILTSKVLKEVFSPKNGTMFSLLKSFSEQNVIYIFIYQVICFKKCSMNNDKTSQCCQILCPSNIPSGKIIAV